MEPTDYLRFILSLAFVLALMGLLGFVLRRTNIGRLANPLGARRLDVIETRIIDARHKLALVRCDTTEHLVVLGPQGQTLIAAQLAQPQKSDNTAKSNNIQSQQPAQAEPKP